MSAHPRPMSDLLLACTGPLVWAGHFFGLYLTEALFCSTSPSAAAIQVRWIGAGLTVIALAALIAFAVCARYSTDGLNELSADTGALFSLAGPLTILSILAVLWSSIPLFLLPACAPGGS